MCDRQTARGRGRCVPGRRRGGARARQMAWGCGQCVPGRRDQGPRPLEAWPSPARRRLTVGSHLCLQRDESRGSCWETLRVGHTQTRRRSQAVPPARRSCDATSALGPRTGNGRVVSAATPPVTPACGKESTHTTPRARRTHTECADVTSGVAFRGVTAGGRAVLTLHSASRSEELCPAVDELCQLPQGHQPDPLEHKRPCERPANF